MALTLLEMLEEQMDDAWHFLLRATDGIDDVLLHWEPAPGSWGLRLTEGRWRLDYQIPDPLPPGPLRQEAHQRLDDGKEAGHPYLGPFQK